MKTAVRPLSGNWARDSVCRASRSSAGALGSRSAVCQQRRCTPGLRRQTTLRVARNSASSGAAVFPDRIDLCHRPQGRYGSRRWYDRALPQLQVAYPGSLLDERGLIGEQLVSVGISLWETGRRNTAVSVTEEGAGLIAQAVQDGSVKKTTLSVPYQNLAEMHRQLGNTEKADRLASKAIDADPESGKATKQR